MNRKHDRSFAKFESDVAAAFRGGDAAGAVADATVRQLSGSRRIDDDDFPRIVSALAGAVARAAAKAGGDAAAEGFMIGIMRGAWKGERGVLALVEFAASSFMTRALDEGIDPGAAVKGLVEGAGAGAREAGHGVGLAVSRAEQGAIDAADRAGPEAGRKVSAALKEGVPGEPLVR